MRDLDVRLALRKRLQAEHKGDADTLIVEEMGVWSGSVRVDVAVINGKLTGYELKSDSDTLERLPTQAEIFSRVFDEICLVVGEKHLEQARTLIPKWWGIIVARAAGDQVKLKPTRRSRPNPSPDLLLVARLLWRSEALEALEARGLAKGLKSKPVAVLHERLAQALPAHELSDLVRATLKGRRDWLGQPVGDKAEVTVY
jgi:hypothetical protein